MRTLPPPSPPPPPHTSPQTPADEVQELDLSLTIKSLDKLLDFLSCSFNGGTDVDRPLALSLERLAADEWKQVGGAWWARGRGAGWGQGVVTGGLGVGCGG
jgi:hypothetical protein